MIDQGFPGGKRFGVIRIPAFYESYYGQLLANKNLCHTLLMRFQMLLVMRRDHPWQGKADITPDMLKRYTGDLHGDRNLQPFHDLARIDPLFAGDAAAADLCL